MFPYLLLLVGALACVPTYSPDDLARIEEQEELAREEEIRREEEILASMTTTTEITTTTTSECLPANCPSIYSCADMPIYQTMCRTLAETSGNPTTMVEADGGVCVFSVICPPAMGLTPASVPNYRLVDGEFEMSAQTTPLSIQCANNGIWTRSSTGVQVTLVNCGS